MTSTAIAISVVGFIISLLLTILGFFVKGLIERMINSIDEFNQNLNQVITSVKILEKERSYSEIACTSKHTGIMGVLKEHDETLDDYGKKLTQHDIDIAILKEK